ncbi:hypothetical protein CRUP_027719 [Coryphaenoides rupestris]|nr:hypothetical protein CRUP_027719 [Coryphaenoides rupestris]
MNGDVETTYKNNSPDRRRGAAVVFGTRQERKLFPSHFAPNRLGNQMCRQEAPHRGPGCYDNHEAVTPSPQKYQQDQTCSRVLPPGKTPFNSSAVRFTTNKSDTADSIPGPGTYSHEAAVGRRVVWPMSFGSPKLPQLEKKTLRAELQCDRDFKKQRARVAYLSLYF